jgi:hypothetical protein
MLSVKDSLTSSLDTADLALLVRFAFGKQILVGGVSKQVDPFCGRLVVHETCGDTFLDQGTFHKWAKILRRERKPQSAIT